MSERPPSGPRPPEPPGGIDWGDDWSAPPPAPATHPVPVAPWDLPEDEPGPEAVKPEPLEDDTKVDKRPGVVRSGREMARVRLALSRSGTDPNKLSAEELQEYLEDARSLAENERGRVRKKVSVRKALKNNVLKEAKVEKKRARKEGKVSRREMNKAYNAKLSVSLGKLAWHLTGGRVTRKAKEAYSMLTLPQQAAVSGIGSFAITMVSAEAARFVAGDIGERLGVDMPDGPSRWSELALAAVVGVGMAAYGPIKANGFGSLLSSAGKGFGSAWDAAKGASRGLRSNFNKGRSIGDGIIDRTRKRGRGGRSESEMSEDWDRMSGERKNDMARRDASHHSK